MVRELLHRAGAHTVWGRHVPSAAATAGAHGAPRTVFVIWHEATGGAIKRELRESLGRLSPATTLTGVASPSDSFGDGSAARERMEEARGPQDRRAAQGRIAGG